MGQPGPEVDADVLLRLAAEALAIGTLSCVLPAGPARLNARAAALLGLAAAQDLPLGAMLAAFQAEDRERVAQAIAGAVHTGGFRLEAGLEPSATREPTRVRIVAGLAPARADGCLRLLAVMTPLRRRSDGRGAATRLAEFAATAENAVIGATLAGVVTQWSAAAEELFGYSGAEIIGAPVAMLVPPGHEEEISGILARIQGGGRVEQYETFRRHRDGRDLRVSLTVTPVHDAAGALVGLLQEVRDIAAAYRATEAVRRAEARLAAMEGGAHLGHLGQLAAMLAHELNQPLTAAMNYLRGGQRALATEDPGGRPAEAMRRALEQVARAAETIRGLRAFARGAPVLARPEALAPILEEAVTLSAGAAAGRGVRVRVAVEPGTPAVMADQELIRQVVLQLVRGALASSAPGEMVMRVGPQDGAVAVSIEAPIAGPSTAGSSVAGPSVASDLTICRAIIEAHGGRIGGPPNGGAGTALRFTLPIAIGLRQDQEL